MAGIGISSDGYCDFVLRSSLYGSRVDWAGMGLDERAQEVLGRSQLEAVCADLRFRLGVAEEVSKVGDVKGVFRGVEKLRELAIGDVLRMSGVVCSSGDKASFDVGIDGFESRVLSRSGVGNKPESRSDGVLHGGERVSDVRRTDVLDSEGSSGSSLRQEHSLSGGLDRGCSSFVQRGSGPSPCTSESRVSANGDNGRVEDEVVRGRWYASNREKKRRRRERASAGHRPVASVSQSRGFCETVVSAASPTCPTYAQALSDAEREARDTLAQRRAAENKVARKLAEMKLASLEDEKKCQEYADLKHQRVIQWTNEATAKSQQSLDKVKSIDPSSSASQYEIRQQAKKLADAEAEVRRVSSIVKTLSPDWQELLERKAESTFNTEYIDELMAKGEAGLDNGFRY